MIENDGPTDAATVLRHAATRIGALAVDGLNYSPNPFDLDRFRQLKQVSDQLFGLLDGDPGSLRLAMQPDPGYVTPKVEVRGALIDAEDRLLMMRETTDGRWSLPGGFADPLDAPSEAVVREMREESGYPVEVVKLVGCWDRERRGHLPALPVSIYKLFFLCRATGTPNPPDELETLEIGWFGIEQLPPLSAGRINRWEIERVLAHHHDPSLPTEFD